MSDASWCHHRESQNHFPEHSRSPFLAGGMIFPPPSRMLDPCQPSRNNWKLISFDTTWLHPKLNKNKKPSSFSLSFSPSLAASLYLFEQCLRLGVMGTSSVCLPLQDESLYVFPNCKSLWIKASAKWLNVSHQITATADRNVGCHRNIQWDASLELHMWIVQINLKYSGLLMLSEYKKTFMGTFMSNCIAFLLIL